MAAPTNDEPPLVDVKVTNPLTYIKRWWNRIIGNEGIDFRFRVRPLTAIAIALIITTVAFGLGSFVNITPNQLPFPPLTPGEKRHSLVRYSTAHKPADIISSLLPPKPSPLKFPAMLI